jgi:hypothetical protein
VFHIRVDQLPELERRIEALDRRARRLGTAPIHLRREGQVEDGHVRVVLDGEPPTLAGWVLAAIVDHGQAGPTLRPVTGVGDRLAADRFVRAGCDHCGLRRRRAQTYVVTHVDTGELVQVGSGCLRDFLGGQDPSRLCRQAEYLSLVRTVLAREHTRAPARGVPLAPPLEAFAAHAAHSVRVFGWFSRAGRV